VKTAELRAGGDLYGRLQASLGGNGAKQFLFSEYCKQYKTHGFDLPALIPQVYLHWIGVQRTSDGDGVIRAWGGVTLLLTDVS
jgi:hypothetical protein